MEEGDLFSGGAGEIYEARIKGLDATTSKIFEKATESNKVIRLSKG